MTSRCRTGGAPSPASRAARRPPWPIFVACAASAVLLLGANAANAAGAEWTRLGVSAGAADAYVLYIDRTTIRRDGDRVRMWDLQDFKQAQPLGERSYRSEKTELEFDCKARRTRVLSIIDFSGGMATGEIVYSDGDPSDWVAVKPATLGELEWQAACGTK